ncbi:MAG TPA: SBBP repeat-containing protein, partial [Gemmatimonadales bacterium]|nr:SBBP repeat-containing protein [Gemmatimonadales bacterium]
MTRFSARPVLLVACLAAGFTLKCGEPSTGGNIVGADSLAYTLRFASYLGGAGTDLIRDVAIDLQGNIYAAGSTLSPGFPTTTGVFQPVFNQTGGNPSDAFITKFGPGGQVIWSTFLGGPGYERIYGMEVDELGYLYVAGRAGAGFPVTPGAFQTNFGGDTNPNPAYGPTDGFVCKIKPDGTQIVFCSYFGNKDRTVIRDIAIDANHDIYVASAIHAVDTLPSAWFATAYQKTIHGEGDALIAKIKGDGSRVEWATILGGSKDESIGISIRVNASGVYVATSTTSPDMPTPNGFSHTLNGTGD